MGGEEEGGKLADPYGTSLRQDLFPFFPTTLPFSCLRCTPATEYSWYAPKATQRPPGGLCGGNVFTYHWQAPQFPHPTIGCSACSVNMDVFSVTVGDRIGEIYSQGHVD